jgi:hypothetical protein
MKSKTIGIKEVKKKVERSEKAKVQFYEGYKEKETPRSVIIDNREINILRILQRKRVIDQNTGELQEIFTCETEEGKIKITISQSGESVMPV